VTNEIDKMNKLNFLPVRIFETTKMKRCTGKLKSVSDEFPEVLRVPLIKSSQGDIQVIKSGRRSAIYYDVNSDKYYRIKGCGLNDNGFEYKEIEVYTDDRKIQIKKILRGCQFEKNCKKELEITIKLREIFQKKGLYFPNKSLGYWAYELGYVEKPCASLYETTGELRLNDDILYYLESKLWGNYSIFEDLHQLYYKIGLKIGEIKQLMTDAGYLWGTFFSDFDGIFHSNAHINNIIASRAGDELVLGPVDFDLAFFPGELKDKEFEYKVEDEIRVLEASIKGWQVFDPPLKIFSDSENNHFKKLQIKLRTNLYKGFLNGMNIKNSIIKFSEISKFF